MIRVLVAAASAIVRSGLEAVVRSSDGSYLAGSMWTAEVRDGTGDSCADIGADVLLIALAAADEEWLRTLAESACPVVLLTEEPDAHTLSGNLRSTLLFDSRPEEIAAAIAAVAEGLAVVQPAALERRLPRRELEEPLSPRETEVLRMLAEGLSNKLIAHRLGISEHTVKFHVTQVMAKLRASSRTDAAMQGLRRGLILM